MKVLLLTVSSGKKLPADQCGCRLGERRMVKYTVCFVGAEGDDGDNGVFLYLCDR